MIIGWGLAWYRELGEAISMSWESVRLNSKWKARYCKIFKRKYVHITNIKEVRQRSSNYQEKNWKRLP